MILMGVAACIGGLLLPGPSQAQDELTGAEWREDLAVYLADVPRTHVAPYNAIDRETFEAEVAELAARVDRLEAHEIVVGIARITSLLGDGHTRLGLTPNAANGFQQYPILLYWMDGDLVVLGIEQSHAHLLGSRVTRIGGVPAAQALERVAPLIAADNVMGVRDQSGRYLAIPQILHARGLAETTEHARYTFARPDGGTEEVTLTAIPDPWLSNLSSRPWVERTDGDRIEFSMAYDTTSPPLWLTHPDRTFWFARLRADRALYVQLNRIANAAEETMSDFFDRVYATADSTRPARLVLDLRLNGGGNNMLNLPVVLGLVRRPWLDRRGKVFVLISRHTFSAASHLVTYLERLTHAVFVGEPTGASPNHYGDAATVTLPNSGLQVRASTIFWQNSLPAPFETREWTAPELAAPMTVEAYVAGEDPALELALAWVPQPSLASRLRTVLDNGGGAEDIRAIHRAYRNDPVNRWADEEQEMNILGYALLEDGHLDAAVLVFRFNAEDHPRSANAFDSLGDGLLAQGDTTGAIEAWRHALRVDPTFAVSAANLRRLGVPPDSR